MEHIETFERIPAAKLAKKLVQEIKHQRPDYIYLAEVFKHVRKQLDVKVLKKTRKLPFHESRKSLEVDSRLSLVDAQDTYNSVIKGYTLQPLQRFHIYHCPYRRTSSDISF